jgi:hypothetical protein
MTGGVFLPSATCLNWPGDTIADWATSDYKRLWIEPGLSIPLVPFQAIRASAVVFIVDASFQALRGGYLPFTHGFEPIPALHIDGDTGRRLRLHAATRPTTRLTLTATVKESPTNGITMVADLPQTQGWIDAHPNIVKHAAAELTVEHLGCTEWVDTVAGGYRPTGLPEMFAVWTTQGKMFELTRDTVVAHRLPRTALLRPPVQFGVGGAFQSAGISQTGAIAGPEYLLTISPHGDLDKLDEVLAARQIAWLADLATRLDPVPASELRQGDPMLGA